MFATFVTKRLRLLTLVIVLLALMGYPSVPAYAQTEGTATAMTILDPVVHDLCGKNVALLGESPLHSFGKTLDFKVALVRRLVDECHYDALFVESGTYDYINIEKKLKAGQDVTDSMISAAIGGLWANKEVESLIPFLKQKVNAGSLRLGGLDDQIGRGSYAQSGMPADLVQYLQVEERPRCLAILQRHMLWQYTDDAPYAPADKVKIVGCLQEIEDRLGEPDEGKKEWAAADRMMIESLKRNFARNFTEDDFQKAGQATQWMNDRDRSMYLNFQWLLLRLPRHSKVIVWAATVHTAKDLSGVNDKGFVGRVPLGSYIRHDFQNRAFSLGFSAYSGSYSFASQPVRQLTAAPDDSLEGKSFTNHLGNAVYLSRKQLRNFGLIGARPLGNTFDTAPWDEVLDGLVIFREERPPEFLHH